MKVKKRKRSKRRKNKMGNKGFSLIEILAVIVIIGIMSAIGIAAYGRYKEQAIEKDYEALRTAIRNASDEYIMDHPNAKEFTFDDLLKDEYISSLTDPKIKSANIRGRVKVRKGLSDGPGSITPTYYTINYCTAGSNKTYDSESGVYSDDLRCKADPYDLDSLPTIKVLNVYPKHIYNGIVGNQLKGWMDSYGKGKIQVTPVYIETFNANPSSYLKKEGDKWNYDEIVFGFVDCNGYQDISSTAATEVEKYLKDGGAAIFGHDTLTKNGCGHHDNFNSLAKYVGLTLNGPGVEFQGSTTVKIVRKGVFTQFPYDITENGTVDTLTIPESHVYGQVANGEVWITFDKYKGPDANKVYLSTYGNNAFIQTGHSNGEAKEAEQKILVNIIIYMIAKQYVSD